MCKHIAAQDGYAEHAIVIDGQHLTLAATVVTVVMRWWLVGQAWLMIIDWWFDREWEEFGKEKEM